MGVWIEILFQVWYSGSNHVTPCVGVWIEIYKLSSIMRQLSVTPCVGVWIEMVLCGNLHEPDGSLPAWECGLKSYFYIPPLVCRAVTPCVGVWIEILISITLFAAS